MVVLLIICYSLLVLTDDNTCNKTLLTGFQNIYIYNILVLEILSYVKTISPINIIFYQITPSPLLFDRSLIA